MTKKYIVIVFYFSPAKDCVSIPGIDDISPEEMRHEALSAKTAGTSAQYQQNLQGLIQGYQNKRQALLNPSQDLKEVLRKIYSKAPLKNIPPNLFQIVLRTYKQSLFSVYSASCLKFVNVSDLRATNMEYFNVYIANKQIQEC